MRNADRRRKKQKNDRMKNVSKEQIKRKLSLKLCRNSCKNSVPQNWVSYEVSLLNTKISEVQESMTLKIAEVEKSVSSVEESM